MTKKSRQKFLQVGWHFLGAGSKNFFLKGRHLRSSPRAALVLGTPLHFRPIGYFILLYKEEATFSRTPADRGAC